MSDEPAETRWWEAASPDAQVPVALIRVEVDGSAAPWGELSEESALRRRAQYTAGIEYLAAALGAAQPLSWDEDNVTLVLGGVPAEALLELAFEAAQQIWARTRLELDVLARIAAHVTVVRWGSDSIAEEEAKLREQLASIPAGAALLSEDVALALPAAARQELAWVRSGPGGAPGYVFPADASRAADQEPDAGERVWAALRRYAHGPEVRLVRYAGFRLQRRPPPRVDVREVFVQAEVEVAAHARRTRDPGAGRPRELPPAWSHSVASTGGRERPFREVFAEHRALVVLGDPGIGKTTLLRWLAVVAAEGRFAVGSRLGVPERLLPILVSVGRLAEVRRQLGERAPVLTALARYLHDRGVGSGPADAGPGSALGEEVLREQLARALDAGSCLVLLDGLDEVHAGERESIRRWLEAFAASSPRSRYVVSSRVVGYSGINLPEGVDAVLRPFDDDQVERYVRALSRAWARLDGGDAGAQEEADAEADKLLDAIAKAQRLRALARNPLLLSALALIHRAEGRLPRHRVQAYELIARTLCETWAVARRVVAGEAAGETLAYEEEALPILGELALAMHERYPSGVAPQAFVLEALARALEARAGVTGEEAMQAAREFLRRAGEEVQILLERGAGEWGFLHLTFQEFFTAAGLHAAERFEEVAREHLLDPRWQEVIRLGVGYLALVQKRPVAARRFVEMVLAWEEPEPRSWVTRVLGRQIPLAALLAAEAGDALPAALQERVARALAEWVVDPPLREAAQECLKDISLTDFAAVVVQAVLAVGEKTGDADARRLYLAIDALKWLEASDTGPLWLMFHRFDESVRRSAIWAIEDAAAKMIVEHVTLDKYAEEISDVEHAFLLLLEGDDPRVHLSAAHALGNLASLAAVPRLLELAPQNPAAREALWKIAEQHPRSGAA